MRFSLGSLVHSTSFSDTNIRESHLLRLSATSLLINLYSAGPSYLYKYSYKLHPNLGSPNNSPLALLSIKPIDCSIAGSSSITCVSPDIKENSSGCFIFLVNNVKLVRPQKAKAIEDMIIRNGMAGAIQDKISEDTLISYLENFQDEQTTTITIKKKIDDEDDIDADLEGL